MVSCLGSLVQSCCGEGGALQTNITGLYGEHLQCSGHTRFNPAHGVCVFPVYAAQAAGCSIGSRPWVACCCSFRVLHKSTDSAGPAFCAFPSRAAHAARSTLPGYSAPYPLRGPSLSFPTHQSGVPCVCSWKLVSSRGPPGRCQPSRILGSLWLESGRLPSLGLSFYLPPCLLPPVGDGLVHCWLTRFWNCLVLPFFCEWVGSG